MNAPMAGKRRVRAERRAACVAWTVRVGYDAKLHPATLTADVHAGEASGGRRGLPSSPTMQHPRVAPAIPSFTLDCYLVRASQHPTHKHDALLLAYELRHQHTTG
ncbi:hypothetical protein D1007_56522 [Hordeum vulgare]|nr:hypothetical protein D1007_56522 [Hordeum vulgare]